MPRFAALPRSHWLGYAVLALWLAWTAIQLAALARPPKADAARLQQLLGTLQLQGQLPPAGQPVAIQLRAIDCACHPGSEDARHWRELSQQLAAAGGRAIRLDWPHADRSSPQVVLLSADRRPLYAGPLELPAALCGQDATGLARWLPALLDGHRAPVLLAPSCPC